MINSLKQLRVSFIIFLLITLACFLLRKKGSEWGWDMDVLMAGNFIVFLTSLLSHILLSRSLQAKNPQVFVRAMYGSFILKFFIIVIAAFVYIMMEKKNVNKPAIFVSLGLYFIYMFIEISVLTRMMKAKKHG